MSRTAPGVRSQRRIGLTAFGWVLVASMVVMWLLRSRAQDSVVGGIVAATVVVLFVVGVVWPLVVMASTAVSVISVSLPSGPFDGRSPALRADRSPAGCVDLRVGNPAEVRLGWRSSAPRAAIEVRFVGPLTSPWFATESAGEAVVKVSAARRGLFDRLEAEVRCSFPLGVLSARHTMALEVPMRLVIAPRVFDEAAELAPSAVVGEQGSTGGATSGGDLIRSLRPYQVGDPQHLVHWPSTARAGELMVREFEAPPRPTTVIVLELGETATDAAGVAAADPVRIENAVSWAAGLVRTALHRGDRVVLATCESDGGKCAVVETERQADGRLAAAIVGVPGALPAGAGSKWSVTTVKP